MRLGKEEHQISVALKCEGVRLTTKTWILRCAFVGYAQNSKSYRLLTLETNIIIESWDVEFFENLITKDKESESVATKESCGKDSSRIVEI